MAKYETMLVTTAKLDEEATAALVGKFTKLIEKNGSIDAVDEWGKRRLAYPINKEEEGVYTLIHFTSEPDFPMELNRVYKITDGVIRSLIIAKAEGEELPSPAAKADEEKPVVKAEAKPEVEEKAAEEAEAPKAEAPAKEEKAEEAAPEAAEEKPKAKAAPKAKAEPKAEEAAAEEKAEEKPKAKAKAEPKADEAEEKPAPKAKAKAKTEDAEEKKADEKADPEAEQEA